MRFEGLRLVEMKITDERIALNGRKASSLKFPFLIDLCVIHTVYEMKVFLTS